MADSRDRRWLPCGGCGKRMHTALPVPMCHACRRENRCGTTAGYAAGCRCDRCRAAQRIRDARRTYPKRGRCTSCGDAVYLGGTSAKRPKCRGCRKRDRCGTENGYRKGCRCDACRDAQARAVREYAARKRAEGVDIYARGRGDRRARERGAFVAPVDREQVFERDGWVCQICLGRIDRRTKYPHPRSASLDHIVPLSAGGTHEPKNVQCAHLRCNVQKNAGAANDQLRLIG